MFINAYLISIIIFKINNYFTHIKMTQDKKRIIYKIKKY